MIEDHDWLAERFEENRAHLRAVAYRMLGSASEAEDAVQDAWLRLSRSETTRSGDVENMGGWLTTIVARVCLNLLQARKSRREQPLPDGGADPAARGADADPEQLAVQADAVGVALLVVLDTLSPAERLAFVLHDMFAVPFGDIAPIVERSPTAARQLASRARRRVQGVSAVPDADPHRRREIVGAFLAASRSGDFDALLALLDPDVVLRADDAAVQMGVTRELNGAPAVAGTFSGRALAARPALIDGAPGAVWAPGGTPRVVFTFTVAAAKVVAVAVVADPAQLLALDITTLEG